MTKRFLAIGALVTMLAVPAAGQSLRDVFPDAEHAGILPMETIVALARDAVDGTIKEVELERKHGAWVYEVEVVAPNGQRTELLFDASSGKILSKKLNRH